MRERPIRPAVWVCMGVTIVYALVGNQVGAVLGIIAAIIIDLCYHDDPPG